MVGNVIRHKRKYAYLIENLSGRIIEKLDKEAVVCLMLGLTQLEQESRIDEYAAVNETVNLIAALGKPFLKGFINANLRTFLRKKRDLLSEFDKQALEIRTSHNSWMVERWRDQFGDLIATRVCEANNIQPHVQMVVKAKHSQRAIMADLISKDYEITDHHSEGWTINNPSGLFETKWAKQGAFLIQDRSSQLINRLIKRLPKKWVLDACAAPGGKLFHMEWAYSPDIDELIALDVSNGRLKRLLTNKNTFQSRARIVQMDATNPALKKQFDLVMVDAPCSSTGTIRKNPEIKWIRQEIDLLRNQQIQVALLQGLMMCVRQGGHLLYITCSLEKEENQQVVEKFLENNSGAFRLVPIESDLVDREFLTSEGYFQCLPNSERMGTFAALMRRE